MIQCMLPLLSSSPTILLRMRVPVNHCSISPALYASRQDWEGFAVCQQWACLSDQQYEFDATLKLCTCT